MLRDYLPILILLTLSTGLACLIVILTHLIGPRRDTKLKLMPYESGMNPIGSAVRRMPVRFYLIAVLFILFDIEVVFFLPWAVVFSTFIKNGQALFILLEMFIFIAILLVGYIYAWKKDALEWE
ncbi:MAG: NADH-quinone oxidoreductase subunit A [Chloroflexi bacterium]|nr:NADH-quinone oxidoreductase subunit A [Chloroflexota bacterium]MBI5081076.1 NADH-quinone oxidoreductase subunit A [Chloroflexota bacterium]